jgi:hypothetical protein
VWLALGLSSLQPQAFVDVLRPLPFPESLINRLIVKAIGYLPFVLDAKRNQEAWEARYRERKAAAAV